MFDCDALLELGQDLASSPVADLSDAELMDAAVAAERFESWFSLTRAHLLDELEKRGSCYQQHGLKTPYWVAREANTSSGAVGAQIRFGRTLRERLRAVDSAVVAGEISMEHAKVIVSATNRRNIDGMAERQDEMIADAEGSEFSHWRDTIRRLADLLDQDGEPPRLEDSALNLSEGLDGMGHLRGTFTPEQWLVLKPAILERADRLYDEFRCMHDLTEDIEIPPRKALQALALQQLVHEGLGVDLESTQGPNADVTVILRPGDAEHGEPDVAVDAEGVLLPTGVLPLYLCDASFTAVLVDRMDVPLKHGRKKRCGTLAQRRAAAARDGGCVWPGCPRPASWSHLHHADEWHRDHGLTDIDNLPFLCTEMHHPVVHRTGWSVHATEDGWFFFQTPSGQTFWAQRHFRRRTDPPPPPRQRAASNVA